VPIKKCFLAVAVLCTAFLNFVGASPATAAVSVKASPGCGATASVVNGQETFPFTAAGETGSYIVEGPSGVSATDPLPLIIDLHGYVETAAIQASFSALGSYGAAHGFITVTPQVTRAVQYWDVTPKSADQKFLGALITHVTRTLCVDTHRVFVAGYSNGAFMASALACSYAGEIAAVATVAGIQAPLGCHPTRLPRRGRTGCHETARPQRGGHARCPSRIKRGQGHFSQPFADPD